MNYLSKRTKINEQVNKMVELSTTKKPEDTVYFITSLTESVLMELLTDEQVEQFEAIMDKNLLLHRR